MGRETKVFHPSIHQKDTEGQLLMILDIACFTSRPTSQQLVAWLDNIAGLRLYCNPTFTGFSFLA